jgi:polyhydroxybutyrate depolymerase
MKIASIRSAALLFASLSLGACAADAEQPADPNGAAPIAALQTAGDGGARDAGRPTLASPGCSRVPAHRSGSTYLTISVPGGGGQRRFLVSLPPSFDPAKPHRVIFGFSGRDWIGEQMVSYFGFEPLRRADEILVYPDPLRRTFGSWGAARGWQLGPHGPNAVGNEDITFVRAIVSFLADNYCIDRERVFATGHSWGGDMTHVLSCFTDLFRATVPVAANDPYWFRAPTGPVSCSGKTAVWTMYGLQDTSFNDRGENGRKVRDFWLATNRCTGVSQTIDLNIKLPNGKKEQCVAYRGCAADTRLCLYDAQFGHQIPRAYFAREVLAYFRSF